MREREIAYEMAHGEEEGRQVAGEFLDAHPEYDGVEYKRCWLRVRRTDSEEYLAIEKVPYQQKPPLVELEERLFECEGKHCDCDRTDIREVLSKHLCSEHFRPSAFYNEAGDMLEVFWDNESPFSESLYDKHGYWAFSLMRSQDDREKVVGVNVYGIRKLLREAGFKIVPVEPKQLDIPRVGEEDYSE